MTSQSIAMIIDHPHHYQCRQNVPKLQKLVEIILQYVRFHGFAIQKLGGNFPSQIESNARLLETHTQSNCTFDKRRNKSGQSGRYL